MRATSQGQTGGAGASEVTAAFERVGWGVSENSRHDLGTDLFLMARDERLFDLGQLVGAQVKTGDSYFSEPVHEPDGGLLGWWFRDENGDHMDAWLSHGVPHLIVLHDLNTRVSYWAHITTDVVESTGKGAKVLVPKVNTVDEGHRNALLSVCGHTTSQDRLGGQRVDGSRVAGPSRAVAPRSGSSTVDRSLPECWRRRCPYSGASGGAARPGPSPRFGC